MHTINFSFTTAAILDTRTYIYTYISNSFYIWTIFGVFYTSKILRNL